MRLTGTCGCRYFARSAFEVSADDARSTPLLPAELHAKFSTTSHKNSLVLRIHGTMGVIVNADISRKGRMMEREKLQQE